jgi:hypothetical protein
VALVLARGTRGAVWALLVAFVTVLATPGLSGNRLDVPHVTEAVAGELRVPTAELTRPVLIAAFRGWNDGAKAASLAAGYLAKTWRAQRFADVDRRTSSTSRQPARTSRSKAA